MDRQKAYAAALVLILIFAAATPAGADGIMIPEPIIDVARAPEPFAVKYHHVSVSVLHQTAVTTIDQVFRNPNNVDLEGIYIFPVPEGAAISRFSMWADGRKVSGEMVEAGLAREIYEDIVRKMRDPALLEYAGRNLFRARVYPIPARGEVRVEISYQEGLVFDSGMVAYRYPLNTERFSSADLEDVSISVDIESDVPIRSLYSPSHDIWSRVSGLSASCSWEEKNVRPDRDFILYYTLSERDMGISLAAHRLPGEDGYFMLLVSPGMIEEEGGVLDKDVIFVLDTSGSMAGEKIEQAGRALEFCLNSLNRGDRFNIITFATGVRKFADRPVTAGGDNLRKAIGFIGGMRARGGTDIHGALREALAVPSSNNPVMVVFLTDGLPTVGETDTDLITDVIGKANEGRARIFSFGVGYDVNTHLLDRLSMENGGTVEYVRPGEDIEVRVSAFFSKLSTPVLSGPSLSIEGVGTGDIYPSDLPDIFGGSQVVVFGRYRDGGPAVVRLRGRAGDNAREFVYEGRFDRKNPGNDFIPRLWATRKIAYLMTEIRLHGENRELTEEIIRLSREHGIVTPYTSYLIMEEGSEEDRRRIMPLAESMAPAMKPVGAGFKAKHGRDAFSFSKSMSSQREAVVLEAPEPEAVKYAGRRSFINNRGVWVDSIVTEGHKVTEIRYLSDEYFRLLREHPEVGKYLALGKRVTFSYEGRTYSIIE